MLQKATLKHVSKYIDSSSQVLLRADFNVPIKENQITDPTRIQATLPTIRNLLSRNPKSLVILSHLGRPDGKKNLKYTMRPVADYLETSLGRKVTFLDDCVGESVIQQVNSSEGEIFLCENVRFHPEEEASLKKSSSELIQKTKIFRQQLSRLGNVYINDAFGAAHRNHSSVAGITHKVRAAGLLMEKQINYLGSFIEKPKKPVLAVLGGAKVVDKLQLISNMIDVADQIIIGGGMVHPFLQQIFGFNLGGTKVQLPQNKQLLHKVLNKARLKKGRIHFPFDCVAAKQMKTGVETRTFDLIEGIPDGWQAFDIGPKSIRIFNQYIKRSKSIFWNGPVGVFQIPEFAKGSSELLRGVVNRTKQGATSVIGGGDSVNLVNSLGLSKQVSFISTGGGASLELMQGNSMPGIENLTNIHELPQYEYQVSAQLAYPMVI